MALLDQKQKDAVEVQRKALLAERPYISDDIALPAMHDRAAKIAQGNVPSTFDEDIYAVLFAHRQHKRNTAGGYGIFGIMIVLIGIAMLIWVDTIHFGFKIAVVAAGGWFLFSAFEKVQEADGTFWGFIEILSDDEPDPPLVVKHPKRTGNVISMGGFDVPPQDRN